MRDPGTDTKVEAALAWARDMLTRWAWVFDSDNLLIDVADAEKREEARRHVLLLPDDVMAKAMREFIASILAEFPVVPRTKGGQRRMLRDRIVAATVEQICEMGFAATRNDGSRHIDCGCSIVACVLKEIGVDMVERTVEQIWAANRDQIADMPPIVEMPPSPVAWIPRPPLEWAQQRKKKKKTKNR